MHACMPEGRCIARLSGQATPCRRCRAPTACPLGPRKGPSSPRARTHPHASPCPALHACCTAPRGLHVHAALACAAQDGTCSRAPGQGALQLQGARVRATPSAQKKRACFEYNGRETREGRIRRRGGPSRKHGSRGVKMRFETTSGPKSLAAGRKPDRPPEPAPSSKKALSANALLAGPLGGVGGTLVQNLPRSPAHASLHQISRRRACRTGQGPKIIVAPQGTALGDV